MLAHLAGALVDLGVDVDFLVPDTNHLYLRPLQGRARLISLAMPERALEDQILDYLSAVRPHAVLTAKSEDMRRINRLRHQASAPFIHAVCQGTNLSQYLAEKPWFRRTFKRRQEIRTIRAADVVIGNSSEVCSDLHKLTGLDDTRIRFARSPVIHEGIFEQAEADPGHPWVGDQKRPLLLAAGRLVAVKDYPTLLRALALLRNDVPARLVILGKGSRLKRLKALAKHLGILGSVDFLGYTPNPYAFFQRSDCFVHSSVREGFPSVLVEAMAFGTPVVSTDCHSGPREILKNGQLGRLVPPRSPKQFAEAIRCTLEQPIAPELLRARALEYSDRVSAQAYAEILGIPVP
ncbi:Glycosyltransferase involved in cell wall bisynthesis [Ectothiorhodospira mobilis]|uniref:Glycosyltransferase involved in cell wall bisynthesis n=2 Tax=Ectothiorhodospira mobilis TaxID=195064 RepID=A0A1I4S4J0_ECTMO|nr:Glycosyltransferase involved in cell wall bisynthesis [Ectothiorhodospira mobilis]